MNSDTAGPLPDPHSLAVRPVRTISTETELYNLPVGSLVCRAWAPYAVWRAEGEGEFSQPGKAGTGFSLFIWEDILSGEGTLVHEEDWLVWVLYDAGVRMGRPERAPLDWISSNDYGSGLLSMGHSTRDAAYRRVAGECEGEGGTPLGMYISARVSADSNTFATDAVYPAGTRSAQVEADRLAGHRVEPED